MKAKRQSISFFLLTGLFVFLLQQGIQARPLRFAEEEVLTWSLALGLFIVTCFIVFARKRLKLRTLLEPVTLFFILQGLWVSLRWSLPYGASFALLIIFFVILLFGKERTKIVFYSFGASAFALIYAFILTPFQLLLLFGGLLIYDTLVFRDGVILPIGNRMWETLILKKDQSVLPLSYHLFPLIFLVQALYLHQGFAIVVFLLFLIGLSQPSQTFRHVILIYVLTLLLPYSLSIFFYTYAS